MTGADAFKYLVGDFQMQVTEMMSYRALKIAREVVEGSKKEQCARFWDYHDESR